jgi:hypothetical protein
VAAEGLASGVYRAPDVKKQGFMKRLWHIPSRGLHEEALAERICSENIADTDGGVYVGCIKVGYQGCCRYFFLFPYCHSIRSLFSGIYDPDGLHHVTDMGPYGMGNPARPENWPSERGLMWHVQHKKPPMRI